MTSSNPQRVSEIEEEVSEGGSARPRVLGPAPPSETAGFDLAGLYSLMQEIREENRALATKVEVLMEERDAGGFRKGGRARSVAFKDSFDDGDEEDQGGLGGRRASRDPSSALLKPNKPPEYDPSKKDLSARSWISMVNRYFKAAGVSPDTDEQRVAYAATLLRGAAAEWWRQVEELASTKVESESVRKALFQTPLAKAQLQKMQLSMSVPETWKDFSEALCARFELINHNHAIREHLSRRRQTISVQEY
jgi:hypothetical protein